MAGFCKACGQPLPDIRAGVRLTPLKARIFDAIKRAGPDGISADDLFALVYSARERRASRRTLKAHVWQINDQLADAGQYRIVGVRGNGRSFALVVGGLADRAVAA
jgi:DNA-binding response OmpR family regulator